MMSKQSIIDWADKRKPVQEPIEDYGISENPDHVAFRKFIDKGNFTDAKYYQTLQCSFLPEKDFLSMKWQIGVSSDKGIVSFRSSNTTILYELILQLAQIYFLFLKVERTRNPEIFLYNLRKLQENIRDHALNPMLTFKDRKLLRML